MKYEDIELGSQVSLLSGGPTMTVERIIEDGIRKGVHCQWFAGKKLDHGIFPPESLQLADDSKKN